METQQPADSSSSLNGADQEAAKGKMKNIFGMVKKSFGLGGKKDEAPSASRTPSPSNNSPSMVRRRSVEPGTQAAAYGSVPQATLELSTSGPKQRKSDFSFLLEDSVDLENIVNTAYLERLRKRTDAAPLGSLRAINVDNFDSIEDDSDDELEEDLYVNEYTREWMRFDEAKERDFPQTRQKSLSTLDISNVLPFVLPMPVRQISDKESRGVNMPSALVADRSLSSWVPPESWSISADSKMAPVKSVSTRGPKDDLVSCIRVFRREGNFATVSCPVSITTQDLLANLGRKFFIQGESSSKFQLWLIRKGCELLMQPKDRPLQLQQQMLYEIGYDPENDKFQDILREDNSYLYRWVFSETGSFSATYSTVSQMTQQHNPLLLQGLSPVDQKIFELSKLAADEIPMPVSVDFSGVNAESIPVTFFKNAKDIKTLDLSRNLMLEIPQDFAQLCTSLTSLTLSFVQLHRCPKAIAMLTSLTFLDMSHNFITTLKDSELQNVRQLRELRIRSNRLLTRNSVPVEILSHWKHLERLDLSCNWLRGEVPNAILHIGSELAKDGSRGTNPLVELDLSYNLLRVIPEQFAEHLPRLKKFWIVSNNISRLPDSLMSGHVDLELLDVRGNHIRGFSGDMDTILTSAPTSGRSLTTGAAPFTPSPTVSEPAPDTRVCKAIRKLLLCNNHIGEIKITQKSDFLSTIVSLRNPGLLQLSLKTLLPSLTSLVVSSSKLAFLPDDIFTFTPSLQVLVLNNNQISTLPVSTAQLTSMVRFEIANNTLTHLPASMKEWKSLEILDLRGNNLKELPAEIWSLPIRFLNVSSNVIETWPEQPATHAVSPPHAEGFTRVMSSASSHSNYAARIRATRPDSYASHSDSDGPDERKTEGSILNSSSPHQSATSLASPLASSLLWLSAADNRFESSCFDACIANLSNLRMLNFAHNDIFSIPNGSLRNCCETLQDLYLSGNHLTQLPDEIHLLKKLRRLYLNNNRLGSLPPEIGKIPNLRVLDVGRNQLRYNVANWPYDWNWNYNMDLRYLNLSGNPKLEIRTQPNTAAASTLPANANVSSSKKDKNRIVDASIDPEKGDVSKFDLLNKIRILGVMEVAAINAVPEENSRKRVRVHAPGGSSAQWKKQIGMDPVVPEGNPLFKIESMSAVYSTTGSSNAPAAASAPTLDSGLNVAPLVSYGISDSLNYHDTTSCWDLVILGGKFLISAKEEARPSVDAGGDTTNYRNLKKSKAGECIFGLFDAEKKSGGWCSKFLYDFFVVRFAAELKKILKERQSKRMKGNDGVDTEPELSDTFAKATDSSLIQHALRRTFLLINKQLGELAYYSEYKPKEDKTPQLGAEKPLDEKLRRKQSSQVDVGIGGKLGKNKKRSIAMEDNKKAPAPDEKPRRKFSLSNDNGLTDAFIRTKLEAKMNEVSEDSDDFRDEESRVIGDATTLGRKLEVNALANNNENSYEEYVAEQDESDDEDTAEDRYMHLLENGPSGLIAYLVNSQLYVANCGDTMAVLSRNGQAIPLSMRHTLFSFQASASNRAKKMEEEVKDASKKEPVVSASTNGATAPRKDNNKEINLSRKELHRIRETSGYLSHDGLVCDQTLLTRGFGYFHLLPHVNASPSISVTDMTDQDEFLIIATASFWNTIDYQTAVDVARLKSDDAIEAAMVLRDFALAYSTQGVYSVDDDTVFPEARYKNRKDTAKASVRYRKQDAMTVMVVNLKDWIGGKQKKAFTKIKRRRDETVDSGIARLAPEIEPPTGFVALVFTDVRNSTQLWEKKPIAMRVAIREHNQIMRRNLRHFNGYEVKTEGDAFMVSFKNVLDALRWCMTVQLQLLEADWPQEILESVDGKNVYGPRSLEADSSSGDALLYRGLSIRMGVHCGTPVSELDPITRRMDYFGPVVNKTARVCGAAEGGQILVSVDVEKAYKKLKLQNNNMRDETSNLAPSSANDKILNLISLDPVFCNVGEKKLKGFDRPEPLISLLPMALVGRNKVPPPPLDVLPEEALDAKETALIGGIPSSHQGTLNRSSVAVTEEPTTRSLTDLEVPGVAVSKSLTSRSFSADSLLTDIIATYNKVPYVLEIFETEPQSQDAPQLETNSKDLLTVKPNPIHGSSSFRSLDLKSVNSPFQSVRGISTEEKDFTAEDAVFERLCGRLEAVAVVLQSQFIAAHCKHDLDAPLVNLDLNMSHEQLSEELGDLSMLRLDNMQPQKLSKYVTRIERVFSAIKLATSGSNLKQEMGAEFDDFVRMMKMLLTLSAERIAIDIAALSP